MTEWMDYPKHKPESGIYVVRYYFKDLGKESGINLGTCKYQDKWVNDEIVVVSWKEND